MKRFLKSCVIGLLILLVLSSVQVLTLRFFDPPFTAWMAFQWVATRIYVGPGEDIYTMPKIPWRTLNQFSPHLIRAVLAAEDQKFVSHHGFDFVEMQEAYREMVSSNRVRGASTITMQAARTVFLWPARTWMRKLLEAYYTALLELMWSKKRILEVYLNTVDWGEGVVGAESASRRYYQRSSRDLTPSEAAMLSAILPNPRLWSPLHPTDYLRERQRKILHDMGKMTLSPLFR